MDAINEIKSRLPIEELVGQYVQLKKVGRSFKALCPFHKERTPSFHVSPEKQMAYCFGCHKGGDQFKFIQEIEGLDFRGSLQFLAEKTGIELPKKTFEQFAADTVKKSQRDKLIEIHKMAAEFFVDQLWNSSEGEKVLKYLKKRGIEEKTIKEQNIGFAPDGPDGKDILYSFLLKKDFTRDDILASGLVIARDTADAQCIDRFRMRLMFPIKNLTGNICAFGGRAVRDGDEPKYLNSPETSIYHKSSIVYGLFDAKPEMRAINTAILMEGYMDVLQSRQAGFRNAVACSGTSLTEDQLKTLRRFVPKIIFSFDRDEAGKNATNRAIELAMGQDFGISVAVWDSNAKDPDECLRDDPKVFHKAISSPQSVSDYLFSSLKEKYDVKSASGKKEFMNDLLPFLNKIVNHVELDEWLRQINAAFNISISSLYDELKRFQGKQKTLSLRNIRITENQTEKPKIFSSTEYLLGLLLTHSELHGLANQFVQLEDFEEIELQNIYRSLTTDYNLSSSEQERVSILSLFIESMYEDMDWEAVKREALELINSIVRKRFEREKRPFIEKLKNPSISEREKLLESYNNLLAEEGTLIGKLWQKN